MRIDFVAEETVASIKSIGGFGFISVSTLNMLLRYVFVLEAVAIIEGVSKMLLPIITAGTSKNPYVSPIGDGTTEISEQVKKVGTSVKESAEKLLGVWNGEYFMQMFSAAIEQVKKMIPGASILGSIKEDIQGITDRIKARKMSKQLQEHGVSKDAAQKFAKQYVANQKETRTNKRKHRLDNANKFMDKYMNVDNDSTKGKYFSENRHLAPTIKKWFQSDYLKKKDKKEKKGKKPKGGGASSNQQNNREEENDSSQSEMNNSQTNNNGGGSGGSQSGGNQGGGQVGGSQSGGNQGGGQVGGGQSGGNQGGGQVGGGQVGSGQSGGSQGGGQVGGGKPGGASGGTGTGVGNEKPQKSDIEQPGQGDFDEQKKSITDSTDKAMKESEENFEKVARIMKPDQAKKEAMIDKMEKGNNGSDQNMSEKKDERHEKKEDEKSFSDKVFDKAMNKASKYNQKKADGQKKESGSNKEGLGGVEKIAEKMPTGSIMKKIDKEEKAEKEDQKNNKENSDSEKGSDSSEKKSGENSNSDSSETSGNE